MNLIVRNATFLRQSVRRTSQLRIKFSDINQPHCHSMHQRFICHKARYGANVSQVSPLLSGIKHEELVDFGRL